jgi:hypothetical protein
MYATPGTGMVRTANWGGANFKPKLFWVRAISVFSHRRRRCHLPIDRARSPSRCAHVAHSDGDARRRAFPANAGDSPVSYAAAFPALPSPAENVANLGCAGLRCIASTHPAVIKLFSVRQELRDLVQPPSHSAVFLWPFTIDAWSDSLLL